MIIKETTTAFSDSILQARGLDPEHCVFFDIETTGFKARTSHLYLIGAAFRCPDTSRWTIRQWLSENTSEEAALLNAFSDFLCSFHTLLHFNGKRFDLPYLEEKYTQHQLISPLRSLESVDLYQDFRPLKSFLRLEHMNQKALEGFLCLERNDQYDGGRLIPVYKSFCKTASPEALQLLLLHNQEDVSGMLALTSLYGYVDFLTPPEDAQVSPQFLENRDGTRNLLLTFPLRTPVPTPVSHSCPFGYLTINKSTGKLLLPMLDGTLYYFFEDYKNYYYLPQEDQAIHKSVAAYVGKEYRQPAKRENCYTKKAGLFLPQPEPLFTPAFRRKYKDNLSWFLWQEEAWITPDSWSRYLASLLRSIAAESPSNQ